MKQIKSILFLGTIAFLSLSCESKTNVQAGVLNHLMDEKEENNISSEVKIEEKWELPSVLDEISGIVFLEPGRFACVQDESGTIFVYNTNTAEIENEISFAGDGDYEGLAIAGESAYVVRSDGKIYEVKNWKSENPKTTIYNTSLTEDHNVEGLCFDKKNNRLLLALKGQGPDSENYKGVYAFNLSSKKFVDEPVFQIDLKHPVFDGIKEEDIEKIMRPSEIAIHPKTGNFYITDAKNPKILMLDATGEIVSSYALNEEDFAQAEGIAFSPSGDLFISNEGKKGSANIVKVEIAKQ